ncbi:hypothetical protein RR46_03008 [Papilio xuthus]|uniref:Uncharacterized protein n=1 Tax=Papilio xuthus TaxID=66420 RepID=A0A194Q9W9_PAPXU|nr:hypothetical protein RR46_03008 [Papilio xuthus]
MGLIGTKCGGKAGTAVTAGTETVTLNGATATSNKLQAASTIQRSQSNSAGDLRDTNMEFKFVLKYAGGFPDVAQHTAPLWTQLPDTYDVLGNIEWVQRAACRGARVRPCLPWRESVGKFNAAPSPPPRPLPPAASRSTKSLNARQCMFIALTVDTGHERERDMSNGVPFTMAARVSETESCVQRESIPCERREVQDASGAGGSGGSRLALSGAPARARPAPPRAPCLQRPAFCGFCDRSSLVSAGYIWLIALNGRIRTGDGVTPRAEPPVTQHSREAYPCILTFK